jgi:hypothetical protein
MTKYLGAFSNVRSLHYSPHIIHEEGFDTVQVRITPPDITQSTADSRSANLSSQQKHFI